jgi:transposase
MDYINQNYITRDAFQHIRPTLESARKKTKPRQVDLYNVFSAVLYVLKTGCQWRAIPKNFPKWRTCYSYFQIWSTPISQDSESILDQVLKK